MVKDKPSFYEVSTSLYLMSHKMCWKCGYPQKKLLQTTFQKRNKVKWIPQTKDICLQSVCKYCGYFECGYYCQATSNGYNFSSIIKG